MLITKRKIGESITISGPCIIHLKEYKGGKVVMAIEAPPEVKITQGEKGNNPKGVSDEPIHKHLE